MKVFLSWSGARSHAVAKTFADSLPTLLPGSKPWISSSDIDKGATWITEIRDALNASKGIGVFFVTREALSSPWLNYEAGAIASLGAQRVCVVCVDIAPGEMTPPLSLFQGTVIERGDVLKLLKTLNAQLDEPSPEPVLEKIFGWAWTELEVAIKHDVVETEQSITPGLKKPTPEQVMADIASGVQRIESRLSALEVASHQSSGVSEKADFELLRQIETATGRRDAIQTKRGLNALEALASYGRQAGVKDADLALAKARALYEISESRGFVRREPSNPKPDSETETE